MVAKSLDMFWRNVQSALFMPYLIFIGLVAGFFSETLHSLVPYLLTFGAVIVVGTAIVPSRLPRVAVKIFLVLEYGACFVAGTVWALIGYAAAVLKRTLTTGASAERNMK